MIPNRQFTSIGAFGAHVETMRVKERLADIGGRQSVVETLSSNAQRMIGKPSNFAPLAARTIRERLRLGYAPYETLLRTGDYRRSFSWAHTGSRESGMGSSSPLAVYHELGGKLSGHPPQRSVIAEPAHRMNTALFMLYGKTYRVILPF